MTKTLKRIYEKKLLKRVLATQENRAFLLEHFRKEWEEAENAREKVERESQQKDKRRQRYQLAVDAATATGVTLLGLIAVCGLLTAAVIAPNAVGAFGRIRNRQKRRYFDKKKFDQRLWYFTRRRYIEIRRNTNENIKELCLTKQGEERLASHELGKLRILPQQPWDEKWRVLIFDIPEQRRWVRDGVRTALRRMGCYKIQKSVFVTPYPCRKEIEFLEQIYNTGNHLRYIETNTISHAEDLKEYFKL